MMRKTARWLMVAGAVGLLMVANGQSASTRAVDSAGRDALVQAQPTPQGAGLTIHGDPPDPTDVPDELKRIYQHIDANFEAHVERLRQWVRIPNVSNTVEGAPGVWESAKFLQQLITKDLGCTADVHSPGVTEWGIPAHPVVYGRCDVGAQKTVLDYIQADVMPVWPEEDWPAPPFGGQIVPKPPFKRVMYGRGVSNQKGKEMAQLAAYISMKAVTGTLPVNVVFLADHDEERMELGPRKFMFDHPDLFKGVDVAFGYAGAQLADGRGEIVGQSIGTVVFDLTTRSPKEGTLLTQQPMWRHFKMMATVFGDEAPLIKDIEKDVQAPSPAEVEYIRREAQQSGDKSTFEQLMSARTRVRVTVTGTWGGNMNAGSYAGNIRPSAATSKVDIRFPPEVDGDVVLKKVRAYLDKEGYADVEMKVIGIVPWSWANADNDMGQAIRQMYTQFHVPFNEPPKGNYMGTWSAYGPPYLFTRGPLHVPHLRGGLGYGSGAHLTPQGEYYVIEGDGKKIFGFAGAIKSAATVLYNYAGKSQATAPKPAAAAPRVP